MFRAGGDVAFACVLHNTTLTYAMLLALSTTQGSSLMSCVLKLSKSRDAGTRWGSGGHPCCYRALGAQVPPWHCILSKHHSAWSPKYALWCQRIMCRSASAL